jgi:hypothetical protein
MSNLINGLSVAARALKTFLPSFQTTARLFSSSANTSKIQCSSCGAELPEKERIDTLFRERQLQFLRQEVKCPQLRSFDFSQRQDCELTTELDKVTSVALSNFPGVVYQGKESCTMLETLKPKPEGELGDLTGDHGKQVTYFLRSCFEEKLITDIGSIVDVGGKDTSTVDQIVHLRKSSGIPSLIIDISSLTPLVSSPQPHIKYAIGDACQFFSSEKYENATRDVINDKPTLVIFNNMLNLLTAKDGWKMLEAAWKKMRSGDYLLVSGLVPEQLEKYGLKRLPEVDGIVEFHNEKGLYKSALLPQFGGSIEKRLEAAKVAVKSNFQYQIETKNPKHLMKVQGYRLLVRKA